MMCDRLAVVFLVGIILWACSVSFGQPIRVDRAYRAADGTFDAPYRWQDTGAVGSANEYGD